MMYYKEDVLFALASSIGTLVKIDINIRLATYARFAKVCMEIDLTKPLVACFCLDDKWYFMEYEGIHTICFSGGMYGHRSEVCPTTVMTRLKSGVDSMSTEVQVHHGRSSRTTGQMTDGERNIPGDTRHNIVLGHGPSMIVPRPPNKSKTGPKEAKKNQSNRIMSSYQ